MSRTEGHSLCCLYYFNLVSVLPILSSCGMILKPYTNKFHECRNYSLTLYLILSLLNNGPSTVQIILGEWGIKNAMNGKDLKEGGSYLFQLFKNRRTGSGSSRITSRQLVTRRRFIPDTSPIYPLFYSVTWTCSVQNKVNKLFLHRADQIHMTVVLNLHHFSNAFPEKLILR